MAACECSICTEEIKKETGQVTLACSHQFHLGCIGRWLMRSDSCPLCRGETVQEEKFLADEELSEDELNDDEDDLDEMLIQFLSTIRRLMPSGSSVQPLIVLMMVNQLKKHSI